MTEETELLTQILETLKNIEQLLDHIDSNTRAI
jgi:hypothetical protein